MTPPRSHDSPPPAVRRSIRLLIASEIFGVEVFGHAERHARTPADRANWQALHDLEAQTRAAVFARLEEEVERFTRDARIARAIGVTSGASMSALPRPLQLRSVVLGTKPFFPHFRRLERHFAGTPQERFFGYIVQHETAIADFGTKALAGDDHPAAAVEALIGNVPD